MAGSETVASNFKRSSCGNSGLPQAMRHSYYEDFRTGMPQRQDVQEIISGPDVQQVITCPMTVCFRSDSAASAALEFQLYLYAHRLSA